MQIASRKCHQIENFGVSLKVKKAHEKGDLSFVMKVPGGTMVSLVEISPKGYISQFYYSCSIHK